MLPRAEAGSAAEQPIRPTRRSLRGWLSGRLGLLVLVPLVLYSLYVVTEKSIQTYRLRQEAAQLRAEVEAQKQENLRLQRELVEARSDQQVEDSARRYLNLVKPGDTPVVLLGPLPTPSPTPPPQVRAAGEEPPGWLRWLSTLLGQ